MRMLVLVGIFFLSLASFQEEALADDPVIDCDGGCTIVTCNATHCTVYWCRNGLCKIIDHYPKNQVQSLPGDGHELQGEGESALSLYKRSKSGPGDLNCGQTLCVIKSCADGQCTVFGFENGEAIQLDVIEDSESGFSDWIDEYLSKSLDAQPGK